MTDLDTLRPEVRCALGDLSYIAQANHTGQQQVNTIRAELLRLAERNAALEAKATRDFEWNTELLAVNKQAEAELAALKARIAASPVTTGDEYGLCVAAGWDGVRVRLIVEE